MLKGNKNVGSNQERRSIVRVQVYEVGMVGIHARAVGNVPSAEVGSANRDSQRCSLRSQWSSAWIRWHEGLGKAARDHGSRESYKPYLIPTLLGLSKKLDHVDALQVGSGSVNLGLAATVNSIRGVADLNYRVSKGWSVYGGAWLERQHSSKINFGGQLGARLKWP